jgi:hypothetical protein
MEIIGSKNGTIKKSKDMTLIKRAGESIVDPELVSRSALLNEMEKIKKGRSLEDIELEKEKTAERYNNIKQAFENWLKEDHITKFKDERIVMDNHVIIKVFYYNELPKSSVLLIDDSSSMSYHRIYPIAIVVVSSSPNVFPGDLVKIPAVFGKTVESREWVQYQKDIREQPSLKQVMPEPPAYVGKLNEWTNYIYQCDPFTDTSLEDQHTFCIPDRLLQTKNIKTNV